MRNAAPSSLYISIISIILYHGNTQTVTITRQDNGGDLFQGITDCAKYGGISLGDNECVCKRGSNVPGTFFTGCLYGNEVVTKTGII